jgi:hypothetical protein
MLISRIVLERRIYHGKCKVTFLIFLINAGKAGRCNGKVI